MERERATKRQMNGKDPVTPLTISHTDDARKR